MLIKYFHGQAKPRKLNPQKFRDITIYGTVHVVVIVLLQYLVVKEWLGKDGRPPNRVYLRGRGDTHTQDGDEDVAEHYNRAPT